MLKIEKYGDFKHTGKTRKKSQIILCHTSREIEEYLSSLTFRFNGSFDRIPNYVICRKGKIRQLISDLHHSNFFTDETVNQNSIIISLENLGWLEKKPLTNFYINWNGSIYKEEVYEKKWRDFFFWQPYTEKQIFSVVELCKKLTESFHIERKCIGHNTKVEGVTRWGGIISRSNIDTRYTDLNPSFDFENFTKFIENEQYA